MIIRSSEGAERIVRRVRDAGFDDLVIVLGTGCCDSTAPFLYSNYLPEPGAQPVGDVDGVTVLAPRWLADLYPGEEALVLDVDEGVVNDSLSLESEYDCRLTLHTPATDRR